MLLNLCCVVYRDIIMLLIDLGILGTYIHQLIWVTQSVVNECSLGVYLVIDNFVLCSFRYFTSVYNLKAIGSLLMEILYFEYLGVRVSFGCERSCHSARRLSNVNSNVPQGGTYPPRRETNTHGGNYRKLLIVSPHNEMYWLCWTESNINCEVNISQHSQRNWLLCIILIPVGCITNVINTYSYIIYQRYIINSTRHDARTCGAGANAITDVCVCLLCTI